LVNAQGGDVEHNIEEVNIEDEEVKREGQSHGQQQPDVAPWGHLDKGLVLRAGVEGVGHLDGDKDGESHGHGLGGTENFARDSLEVLGGGVAAHVVRQLVEGHLGTGGVEHEPVGSSPTVAAPT